jgi:hypothetical protein
MQNNEQQKELPLYTLYVAGHPCQEVFFYERAAAELNINLKVKYHGCNIVPFVDENGKETCDVEVQSEKYEDQNLIANQYYNQIYGENWLEQVKKRSKHLILVDEYTKFEKKMKKELKSKIYSTIIINIIFFLSLWAIFNIYIGIIACVIITLIRYFLYTKKYNEYTDVLDDLKFKIANNQN